MRKILLLCVILSGQRAAELTLADACLDSSTCPRRIMCGRVQQPSLDEMQARKTFHAALNFRHSPEQIQLLTKFVNSVLEQVPLCESISSAQDLLTYFKQEMVEEIAEMTGLTHDEIVTSAGDRDFQCERIRQNTPMNVVDGMWGNALIPKSVPEPWQVLVERIVFEEHGEGNISMNHPFMWMSTAQSVGFAFPHPPSAEFANSSEFEAKAFWNAALTASVGCLNFWIPETLGMIAFLEMRSSAPCHKQIQQMKLHGLDFSYYQVHRSIDNPNTGHANQIQQAIALYLQEKPAEEQGPLAQRVYQGYHAFLYTIDAIDEAVEQRLRSGRGGCPRRKVEAEAMKEEGAQKAENGLRHFLSKHQHLAHAFHKGSAKDSLTSPDLMIKYLKSRCDYFPSGPPDSTPFMRKFAFGGPMYGVADETDLKSLREFTVETQSYCHQYRQIYNRF